MSYIHKVKCIELQRNPNIWGYIIKKSPKFIIYIIYIKTLNKINSEPSSYLNIYIAMSIKDICNNSKVTKIQILVIHLAHKIMLNFT